MPPFTAVPLTLEDYWRAVILFGRNVASYKFALAKALLELAPRQQTQIRLEELAEPYARHLIAHLGQSDRQSTSASSSFLDTCRAYQRGEIDETRLIESTVRLGFNNVIDAFHNVHGEELPQRFFVDERQHGQGLRLTDALFTLAQAPQFANLTPEVESRWRLVETAWALKLNRRMVGVSYDPADQHLYAQGPARRIDVTSSRSALNGYQKGFCFYCFRDLLLADGTDKVDVDHFFPHVLQRDGVLKGLDLNGIWNLVLACPDCNRGADGKFARIPVLELLERLHLRNEFLISSHHPLRETLMQQSGSTAQTRSDFLQRVYHAAQRAIPVTWEPQPIRANPF